MKECFNAHAGIGAKVLFSQKNKKGAKHTKKPTQMLNPINITSPLPLPLGPPTLPEPTDIKKLLALEAVQQDAAEALVEVLLEAGDDLLEDVGVGGAGPALGQLVVEVGGQDGVGGRFGGQRHELQVFRHVLPVVDE